VHLCGGHPLARPGCERRGGASWFRVGKTDVSRKNGGSSVDFMDDFSLIFKVSWMISV